jgi:hypothetical protein
VESDESYLFCSRQYCAVTGSCRHATDGTNVSDQLKSTEAVKGCDGVLIPIEVL